jgi:hypothetical protein
MFLPLINDRITLIKANGQRLNDIPANVQTNMIFVQDVTKPFEMDDIIERILPNGIVEQYLIIDPVLYTGMMGMPGHFEIKVQRKRSASSAHAERFPTMASTNATTNINLSGNARFYTNSSDNSVNNIAVIQNPEIVTTLREIKNAIESWQAKSTQQKTEMLDIVSQIEEQMSKNAPNKSLIKSMLDALPKLDSIVSLGQKLWTLISLTGHPE